MNNNQRQTHMDNPIFLGSDGLTQTSANHLANIAKEMYEALETKLEALKLVSRDFTLAVNGESYRVENESTPEELSASADALKEIASLKALIAWLREGIKAKDTLLLSDHEEKWIKEQIKSGKTELEFQQEDNEPTFEKILGEMPADFQARYYALEAKCAVYGKFIHPDGHFAEIRKVYFNKLKNPTSILGRGQDAEINTFSTNFTPQDVDEVFFSLQKHYRSAQAEFNSMKAEVDGKLSERYREFLDRRERLYEAWKNADTKERLSYREKIKSLKIVVPESLKGIFNKVNAVAAQK